MASFSGTDINTLQEEGNERNCFVSLIVNNEGTYSAAITRKLQSKHEVTVKNLGQSYEFFGDGEISTSEDGTETTKVVDKEVIQYFWLKVEREEYTNSLSWLDDRFDEIIRNKSRRANNTDNNLFPFNSFHTWLNSELENPKDIKESNESSLWENEVKKDDTSFDASSDIDWEPDPTIIHHFAAQMITCSLIVNKEVDLKQWIYRHMDKKYSELFPSPHIFEEWKDFIVEHLIYKYIEVDCNIPVQLCENTDEVSSRVAMALYDELYVYTNNTFIEEYKDVISRYIL